MTEKHFFRCDCGHEWWGLPAKERRDTRKVGDELLVRCPACRKHGGRHVPEQEARPPGKPISPTKAENDLSDYVGILSKVRDSEALRSSIRKLASGGELGVNDIIKLSFLDKLSKSENPSVAFSGLQSDLRDLRRDLQELKNSRPQGSQESVADKLLSKVIASIDLSQPRGIDGGELREILASVKSNPGVPSVISSPYVELKRIGLEYDARRAEANERRAWHRELIKTFEKVPQQAARILGREIVDGYERAREKRKGNPHPSIPKGFKSPEPIKISGTPIPGTDLLKIECPSCRSPIKYNQSSSRVFCVNCKSTWTVVPEKEPEQSRSPDSASPRPSAKPARPGVENNPHSQVSEQDSHDGVTGNKPVVVGGLGGRGAKGLSLGRATSEKKQKGGKK